MSADVKFVYRADDTLATAYGNYLDERRQFFETCRQWNEDHPDTPNLAFRSNGYNLTLNGFYVGRYKQIEGLRKADYQGFTVPYANARGDKWRDVLASVGVSRIDFEKTLTDHGIDHFGIVENYICHPGFERLGGDVFVRCAYDLSRSPHLTAVRMSEYWAAKEAHEEATAVTP